MVYDVKTKHVRRRGLRRRAKLVDNNFFSQEINQARM